MGCSGRVRVARSALRRGAPRATSTSAAITSVQPSSHGRLHGHREDDREEERRGRRAGCVKMRRISSCPSGVVGPDGRQLLRHRRDHERGRSRKEAANATSAKIDPEVRPTSQLPSSISPIPASTTSERGRHEHPLAEPARAARELRHLAAGRRRGATTMPYIWNVKAPPSQITAHAMCTNSRNSYRQDPSSAGCDSSTTRTASAASSPRPCRP